MIALQKSTVNVLVKYNISIYNVYLKKCNPYLNTQSIGMLFCLVLGMLTGCGQKEEEARVYYLTYKPEAADSWKEIAEAYEAETGIEICLLDLKSVNYIAFKKAGI